MHSEDHFLALIDKHFPNKISLDAMSCPVQSKIILGRGDDCAILDINEPTAISSDIFLETAHFRREYFSPEDIGYKALAVNLSDLAAMGAKPFAFSLDLMIPKELDYDFWDRLLAAMAQLSHKHGIELIGGDLSHSPILGLGIHIWGTPWPNAIAKRSFLTRGNAQIGDLLAIVGQLGLAHCGLLALENTGSSAIKHFPQATKQHLRPSPRIKAGQILAQSKEVHGLMDISDGLARDLPRFLHASKHAGAELILEEHNLHPECLQFCAANKLSPIKTAMLGGEDYALLTAFHPAIAQSLQASIPDLWIIGTVSDTAEILLNGKKYTAKGFDHFGE